MCGIFGLLAKADSGFNVKLLDSTLTKLFKLSESRGKEASGVAFFSEDKIHVYKETLPASKFIRLKEYRSLFNHVFNEININRKSRLDSSFALMGHSRLMTNGALENNDNNQPVVSAGAVGVHNGIIVNDEELWKKFPRMERKCGVDTEVLLALIKQFHTEKSSLIEAVGETFTQIRGSASVALMLKNSRYMVLATNTGSLYMCRSARSDICIFTSERYILERLIATSKMLRQLLGEYKLFQIKPNFGYLIDIFGLEMVGFSLNDRSTAGALAGYRRLDVKINIINYPARVVPQVAVDISKKKDDLSDQGSLILSGRFKETYREDNFLRRCTRCILPETMPFIKFDDLGVCNYCHSYKKVRVKGAKELEIVVEKFKGAKEKLNCIVAVSGGRDSCYGLHYIKTVLGLNPVAYTYDWGMVTDLARRNQSRICSKLGIEHIVVSADIKKKRAYIRKNIQAWLRRPELGIVPLFMAGDKQFFYYANRLKRQLGVELTIFCENKLEKTDFKSGFCGVNNLTKNTERTHTLYITPFANKIKIASYYIKQYMLNPAYINTSITDTLFAYFSTYFLSHDYLLLYEYVPWNEEVIIDTLRKQYDWEVADDTATTWRIGDCTASFYNYIYYKVAGFSEHDTFLSNQIREDLMGREEALQRVREANRPRFKSIKDYLNILDLDYCGVMNRIDSIPTLY